MPGAHSRFNLALDDDSNPKGYTPAATGLDSATAAREPRNGNALQAWDSSNIIRVFHFNLTHWLSELIAENANLIPLPPPPPPVAQSSNYLTFPNAISGMSMPPMHKRR